MRYWVVDALKKVVVDFKGHSGFARLLFLARASRNEPAGRLNPQPGRQTRSGPPTLHPRRVCAYYHRVINRMPTTCSCQEGKHCQQAGRQNGLWGDDYLGSAAHGITMSRHSLAFRERPLADLGRSFGKHPHDRPCQYHQSSCQENTCAYQQLPRRSKRAVRVDGGLVSLSRSEKVQQHFASV
jgi:hypothetical protein